MRQRVIIRIEWPNGIDVRELYLGDGETYEVGDVLSTEHGRTIVRSVREGSDGSIQVEALADGAEPLL
ncbi:MAG: hypothetical protein AAGD10_10615 [Myxococcota bacterium]